ncbi:unnamed protein product [Rotaria socialis]
MLEVTTSMMSQSSTMGIGISTKASIASIIPTSIPISPAVIINVSETTAVNSVAATTVVMTTVVVALTSIPALTPSTVPQVDTTIKEIRTCRCQ